MDEQLRVTDFVPRKVGTLLLGFLLGVTVLAGLEAIYAWMPELAKQTTDGRIAAFDLDSEGSFGAWYSSFVLQLAAVMALIVFLVRRQKADDYHGRYRIWAWAAFCWQVMSIDESASLHEGFKELMSVSTGQRVLGDGSIWWVAAYALILGTMGVRLVLEMRVCRASTASLFFAALCYVTAIVVQLGAVMPDLGARAVMVEEGCEIAGAIFLLLAMTLHARYAILAAHGPTTARAGKPKRQRKRFQEGDLAAAGTSEEDRTQNVDQMVRKPVRTGEFVVAGAKPEAVKKPQATITASRPGVRVDPPQTGVPASRLSKAERRALRKQKQRDLQDELD